jgi:hypothetical protein
VTATSSHVTTIHKASPELTMRPLDAAAIDIYLDLTGPSRRSGHVDGSSEPQRAFRMKARDKERAANPCQGAALGWGCPRALLSEVDPTPPVAHGQGGGRR